MAEKLILCIQFECQRAGIRLPWADIVRRLNPGSSPEAVLQFLAKERDKLIAEGHFVPPMVGQATSTNSIDPSIRGYLSVSSLQIPSVYIVSQCVTQYIACTLYRY